MIIATRVARKLTVTETNTRKASKEERIGKGGKSKGNVKEDSDGKQRRQYLRQQQ